MLVAAEDDEHVLWGPASGGENGTEGDLGLEVKGGIAASSTG